MGKKGKRFNYFDAFESQTKLACKEADLLVDIIKGYKSAEDIRDIAPKAHQIEHEGDEVGHDVFMALATDFITPIEREDIMALVAFLDDVLDYIEDVIQRFYMYDVNEMHPEALHFAEIIQKSCQSLNRVMGDFRNFKKAKNFKQLVIEVNDYEEEADRLFMNIVRDLHTAHRDDPMYVIAWTEVFARMERCTDACEHAADTMRSIVLKNS